MRHSVPSGSWHDDSGKMKVYCIKTMYNKNDTGIKKRDHIVPFLV
jgi:hypothetical protein